MKILVRGTNWIGDAVMSVPALRELRRIFPEAQITMHTRALTAGLFSDASFIDDIISFERTRWKVKDIYENAQFLRDDEYDLAILLPNSFESALISAFSKIQRRIGYNKDLRGLLLTDPIAVPEWKNRRHEVFYYLNLISEVERRMLGRETVGVREPEMHIEVSESRKALARESLLELGLVPDKPTIALGVGATNSRAKLWPAEYFGQLADRLADDVGASVLLVGSKGDADVAEKVYSASRIKPVNLVGNTDIETAMALLANVDLLISNDMGLAHVAPAVGTSTIVLFGPTKDSTTRPFSPLATVLRHDVECSPCMLRDCPIDHRCMTRLTVDTVFMSAINILDANDC